MSKPLKVKKISPDRPIDAAAAKILRTRQKEFYSHWPDPGVLPSREQLHNLRISGKRLRYSAEQLRQFFPDRLALLIDLLKRGQDLLGDFQDCVTQRGVIEAELAKLQRRKPESDEIGVLERMRDDYNQLQSLLLGQLREIWMGMTLPEFRAGLKAMISTNHFQRQNQNGFQSNSPSE